MIVTGGVIGPKKVDVYSIDGWVNELVQLNTGRFYHGCGHYINTDDQMVQGVQKRRIQSKSF